MIKNKEINLFIFSTKVWGGAERNLYSIKKDQDIILYTSGLSLLKLIISIIRILNKNKSVKKIIPLGKKNTFIALILSCFFYRNILLVYNIRATELQKNLYIFLIERIFFLFQKKVIFISNSWAGILVYSVRLGIPTNRFLLSYNWNKGIEYLNDEKLSLNCIMIGNIRPEKGYHNLENIIEKFRIYGIDLKVTIYGNKLARYHKYYNQIIEKNISVVQNKIISNINLFEYDCLLNISLDEGLPTTFLEVGSLGIPTITKAVSGIHEYIVDGLNGVIFYENYEKDSKKIKKYFSNKNNKQNILHRHSLFLNSTFSIEELL